MRRICIIVLTSLLGCVPSEPVPGSATFDGRSVHYLDVGAGEPAVVLVHGWASDSRVWRRQLDALGKDRRVIAIDLPGHGASEEPAREYSMDLFAEAVAAVLDHAGIERSVLVGHSNGVPVVRQFYRRYPERTLGLVVVDGALRAMMDEATAQRFVEMFSGEDQRERLAASVDGMPARGLDETSRAEIRAMALEQPHHAVLGGLRASVDREIWKEDPIEVPLLVILAAQPAWDEEYERFVRRLAPQVDYRVLEGAHHFIMMDRPEVLNDAIASFP